MILQNTQSPLVSLSMESTEQILDFVSEELTWISERLEHPPFEVDADELDEAKINANLNGWIQQGVLFLNSSLTYTDSVNDFEVRAIRIAWKRFTNFLVRHLSKSFEHLTFLLLGREAWPMVNIIDGTDMKRHMVQQLNHPSYFRYSSFELRLVKPNKDWETMLPFLNTNLYLYMKKGLKGMIDFSSIQGLKEGKDIRLDLLETFFKKVISKVDAVGYPVSMRITNDVFIKRIGKQKLTFKSSKRHGDIDDAVAEHEINKRTWNMLQWQNFMNF